MLDEKPTAIERIFPKLTAYGKAIEAGQDGAVHLDALRAEMQNNAADLLNAIEAAKSFHQGIIAAGFNAPSYDDPSKAGSRIMRLNWLAQTLKNPAPDPFGFDM